MRAAKIRIAAIGTLVVMSGSGGLAQGSPAPTIPAFHNVHLRGACMQDRKRFCSKVKPGNWRLIDCYESHQPELSQACHAQLAWIFAMRDVAKRQEAWLATHKPKQPQATTKLPAQSSAQGAARSPAQTVPPK